MRAEPCFIKRNGNTPLYQGNSEKKKRNFCPSCNRLPVHDAKQYLVVGLNVRIQYGLGDLLQLSGNTFTIFRDSKLDVYMAYNGKLILGTTRDGET